MWKEGITMDKGIRIHICSWKNLLKPMVYCTLSFWVGVGEGHVCSVKHSPPKVKTYKKYIY